jgi:hypothetical protein
VHSTTDGDPFLRHLRPGIRRHCQVRVRRHHNHDPALVQPLQLGALPNAALKDPCLPTGVTRQLRPRWPAQGPPEEALRRLARHSRHHQRHLGHGLKLVEHCPTVDRALKRVDSAPLLHDPDLTGHLTTTALGDLQSRAIYQAGDHHAKHAHRGQGPNRPMLHRLQGPPVQLDDLVGRGVRADRAGEPLARPRRGPTRADAVADLGALQPISGIQAAPLNRQGGRACILSRPNRVFSP